jgi:hypothetical protein
VFLLWGSYLRETIFAFAKIARRVYALFLLNAMEKKVPNPVNPALHKPFAGTALCRHGLLRALAAKRRQTAAKHSLRGPRRSIHLSHSDRSPTLLSPLCHPTGAEPEGDGGAEEPAFYLRHQMPPAERKDLSPTASPPHIGTIDNLGS